MHWDACGSCAPSAETTSIPSAKQQLAPRPPKRRAASPSHTPIHLLARRDTGRETSASPNARKPAEPVDAAVQTYQRDPDRLRNALALQPRGRLIEAAVGDGRILGLRDVYNELVRKDDEVAEWARQRAGRFIGPVAAVQRQAGLIYESFPNPGVRDGADPWVIAEARVKGMTVVTYEGRTFAGVPTTNWHRSMPGICRHHAVPCVTLPEALGGLGGPF